VEADISVSYKPFPRSEYMNNFKPKYLPDRDRDNKKYFPSPEACILEIVNKLLQVGSHNILWVKFIFLIIIVMAIIIVQNGSNECG
jgi:hypothetical protein